tara:strand:- start:768 stop:1181 length:414 start_codon:yes stop_codon:yes gene_type:complete
MKGRPRIYNEEELKEKQKEYQKKWYEKNKDKIKQKYNPEVSKVQRENKNLKGFYIIYNDELRQRYIGFSKNVISRVNSIIAGIRIQDTKLHKKFSPDVKWKWRMICFCEEQNEELLNKCEYYQQDYISLNDKLIIIK